MNKIQKLRNKLSEAGINKAQANTGTTEGQPAVFLRWNGDEEIVTETTPDDHFDTRLARFKDKNLPR